MLYLIDASQPWQAEDAEQLAALAEQPALLVLNKIDLPAKIDRKLGASHLATSRSKSFGATGAGLPALKEAIFQPLWEMPIRPAPRW